MPAYSVVTGGRGRGDQYINLVDLSSLLQPETVNLPTVVKVSLQHYNSQDAADKLLICRFVLSAQLNVTARV